MALKHGLKISAVPVLHLEEKHFPALGSLPLLWPVLGPPQEVFPIRKQWGLFPCELQKQAVADYFSVELILQFCSENKGKQTCELLDQEKLSSDMRESDRGLFWSFLDIHLPWMQTVSHLMPWGERQNLQKFGSDPANIYVLLILILGQTFSRDIVTV